MDNLSWGNPVAHRVRVHFNTASAVIYEGMPLCYNYDTTANWAGGSASDGAVTASTSLTAGTPETAQAKYLEVENPADGNLQWFAGVVAKGGWCGKTTSTTANVGQILDIYVPNGAIVPVRAGVACTVSRTILSVIAATQYLGHALDATEARPVAIVEETVNRSTAGLILAKLDPNMFIYQEQHGSALLVGTGATAAAAAQTVNRINVSSAQTAGNFVVLECEGAMTSTGACWDGMYKFKTSIDGAANNLVKTMKVDLHFGDSAEIGVAGYSNAALEIMLSCTGTPDLSLGDVAGINFEYGIDETDGAPRDAYMLHVNAGTYNFDGLLSIQNAGDCGDSAMTGDHAFDSADKCIPVKVAGAGELYYIPLMNNKGD